MMCRHYEIGMDGADTAFSVDASNVTFGAGCLGEAGDIAKSLGIKRIALFTDQGLVDAGHVSRVVDSLTEAGVDIAMYDTVRVEPTDESFKAATKFAVDAKVDGFISVGGGSVIDTAKAANLYATHPADFLAYVNAPIGLGTPVPGALKPHIACPTTSGTGSECTVRTPSGRPQPRRRSGRRARVRTPGAIWVAPRPCVSSASTSCVRSRTTPTSKPGTN
jgi:alcohol dehydrogenase class IV